jgi:hypothetical protein
MTTEVFELAVVSKPAEHLLSPLWLKPLDTVPSLGGF